MTPGTYTLTEAGRMEISERVPFDHYLAWPELSQSVVKHGLASMRHLRAAWTREMVKRPTDRMILGSALHACFLEPDEAARRVVTWTGARRFGKDWDAFRAEHDGCTIVTEGMREKLDGCVSALRAHPQVRRLLEQIEAVEVSGRGTVDRVPMKGRTDALAPDTVIELKLVRSADRLTVSRTIESFRYDMQGCVYGRLFGRERFLIACVEDAPPHDVMVYEVAPAWLRVGDQDLLAVLAGVRECEASGAWPGRGDEIETLELPEWMANRAASSVTFGGAPAFSDEGEGA